MERDLDELLQHKLLSPVVRKLARLLFLLFHLLGDYASAEVSCHCETLIGSHTLPVKGTVGALLR